MTDTNSQPLAETHARLSRLGTQLKASMGDGFSQMPARSAFAVIIQHGGFQILLNPGYTVKRLQRRVPDLSTDDALQSAVALQDGTTQVFQKLCPASYAIPASLMSYIAFPHEGKTYTERSEPDAENPNLPAVFTFVGQFIDHDLTFNSLDLFDDQTGPNVQNFATPKLDLDSMYSRTYTPDPKDTGIKQDVGFNDIFDGVGKFRIVEDPPGHFDARRFTMPNQPLAKNAAYLFDPRNDENQLLLQIHLLLERLHNKLLDAAHLPPPANDAERMAHVHQIRLQVVEIWQSVILNDYLPRVCQPTLLATLRTAFKNKDYSNILYKYDPSTNLPLRMPHEFALGFRFGHSMLRSSYKINAGAPVTLFNNRNFTGEPTLVGNQSLKDTGHFIDWNVFYPADPAKQPQSLRIDSKVTPVVFDLPESTIPDHIRSIGNLPHRNLIRSREINLGCGEDVAKCFGLSGADVLGHDEVESNPLAHSLFMQDQNVYNAAGQVVATRPFVGHLDTDFKTPLWYYILKEAEVRASGLRLGMLGTKLVGEVILGGIYYGTEFNYVDNPGKVLIPGIPQSDILLRHIIDYVTA